ncbi:MAG: hypothetical protein ABI813_09565 [Bacteroidota bacterium]
MPALKNKTILILSPQTWGAMFVSKHHYAVELAKYGNTVYFLNPPDKSVKERILVTPAATVPGLFIISHRLNFPYNIKFHAIGVFHWFMKQQVKRVLQAIGKPVDIVWSFDLGNLYPFKLFPKTALRIFHPVDEPLNKTAIDSAKGAQIIFSVTHEILEKYKSFGLPIQFINHGVSSIFLQQQEAPAANHAIGVGFSGNLLRPDIDRPVFLQIVQENPAIVFECWGSYQLKDANIGGGLDRETAAFIENLQACQNVVLHGAVAAEELARGYQRMDAFLICYDILKDQSSGTNYHKLMEYLASGKVIVSNNVTTYQGRPDLLQMTVERETNKNLPELFKKVIGNLSIYNSPALQSSRIDFANNNVYSHHVETIESCLNKWIDHR